MLWREKPKPPPADLREPPRPRRRWRRLRWLSGAGWLSGRTGLVALAVFLVAGGVFIWWSRSDWNVGAGSGLDLESADGGRSGGVPVGVPLDPVAAADARRYGRPLYAGSQGRPVVAIGGTGEVRELTGYELEFLADRAFVSTGYGLVVRAPGRRGLGVWWEHDPERAVRSSWVPLDRVGWAARQNEELAYLVSVGLGALTALQGLEIEPWQPGVGQRVLARLEPLYVRYPLAGYGSWQHQPAQWRCDDDLEYDLRMGITAGCPDERVLSALADAWRQGGEFSDRLRRVGQLAVQRDAMDPDVALATGVTQELAYTLEELGRDLPRLEAALMRLWDRSAAHGLAISVTTGVR